MLYFKTITFPDDVTQHQIETALRKSAIKKTTVLDFQKSVIDVNRDKDFLGFESKKSLSFTRTKTSLEFMLPKLIINLPKDELATSYKIRLSAVPFTICLILSMGILTAFVGLLKGTYIFEEMSPVFVGAMLFFLLLMLELKITNARIVKSINNSV
ncbi:hypothetical protein EZ428_02490 [Pedobacter frigiditerrae]|uniref:Uncharacterized protein n=1 Tax=Pedobacter frigiditerrae TaxID=2530452 RepID=A0A4R0N2S3_9SPHI|nr:hypothetical protein [Pedobacter frigiditerrae]TCC93657.1 hypothetical protein EZ428_02490 [Pedobacter frigiditerrae]